MSFLSSDLFSFVTDRSLKSKFRGLKDLAKLLEIDVDQNSMENINPDELFAKLIQSPIELDLIKVFALMGWDNSDWKTQHGQYAMKNWWLSALNQEKQHGEAQLLLVMTLRAILADTERYPAPKDVVQVMRQVLLKLIKEGYFKGQDHIEILEALITEDSKKLASIAILQGKTVTELMHRLWVPQKLPTVQHANLQWLNLWVQSNSQQRKLLRQPLNALLHSHLGVEQQYQFAQIIFSHTSFSKQISALEKEVKNYPELVAWLSSCARQIEFKTQLTTDERQQLNCWIGTGNYESLYEILMQIAQSTEDEKDREKTENRYIFWKNYQHFFQEAWLLMPPEHFSKHKSNLVNVKEVLGTEYPVVVLKIENYFVFQYFLGTASKNDLLMTDDILGVEKILNQKTVMDIQLQQLNLVLIHDHLFMWQADLAYTLHKELKIEAKNQKVYYTHRHHTDYLIEAQKADFIHERKQWKHLPQWVKNNLKSKYVISVYRKAALTAQRYNLL